MKLFIKIKNIIKCLFGMHEWEYMWEYNTGKCVFKCNSCGKRIK